MRSLSRVFLHDPEFVSLFEGHASPSEIEHFYYVTTAQEKEANLRRILEYEDPESAIIFCNTKDDVRYVTAFLQRHGFDADQISGDLAQAAREKAMARIKAGELRFLVATDVAARGIDISDLSHVIGYAAPESAEVYVHRTGRTGRAGKAGIAISLVSGLDIGNFRYLQKVNRIPIQERPLPTDEDILERIRERLAVKVEQEMRHIPTREREWQIDRLVAARALARGERRGPARAGGDRGRLPARAQARDLGARRRLERGALRRRSRARPRAAPRRRRRWRSQGRRRWPEPQRRPRPARRRRRTALSE